MLFFAFVIILPAEGADVHFQATIHCVCSWLKCTEHTKSCQSGEVGCWLLASHGIPEPPQWAAAACWTPPPSSSWWTPSLWPFGSTWTWLFCPRSALSCSAYGHPQSCNVGNERFVIYPEQRLYCALQISVRLMCDDKGNTAAAATHPSLPAGTALSLRSSGGSSSSDEPALDDSSSLSARQYVRGLGLSHKHRRIRNPLSDT